MNPNPPPEWQGAPTSEFGPVRQQSGYGYGGPPPKQGVSPVLVVLLTVLVMLLLGVVAAGVFLVAPRLSGGSAAPVTSTVSVTATAPESLAPTTVRPAPAAAAPSGAYECMNAGGGSYSRVAVGSSVTSCEFAGSVWGEYLASGADGGPVVLNAYSPVTGRSYAMSCSGGAVVTCSGGNNAVVHIY